MIDVVLFHHALGRTDGVLALADRLRSGHNTVHVPDLFGGRRFERLDDGVAYVQDIGFDAVLERGSAAAADLPGATFFVGISLGVLPAQHLAQTRSNCAGAALLEACVPATEFGDGWPALLPVQIHGMADDPFFAGDGDLDAARELVGTTRTGELFVYPGGAHLFTDATQTGHDPAATDLVVERVVELLERLDNAQR